MGEHGKGLLVRLSCRYLRPLSLRRRSGVYHIIPNEIKCKEPIQVQPESGLYSKDVKMDQLTFIATGLTMSMDLETWKESTG